MDIKITDTDITLPSGNRLALDALQTFTPDREFWSLWQSSKLDVKRSGIGVRKTESGDWQGFLFSGRDAGVSYTQSDIRAYWVEQAIAKADTEECEPVILSYRELPRDIRNWEPCHRGVNYELTAKQCVNNTYQLRLICQHCNEQTPSAIAWDQFTAEAVIGAIAFAIQENRSPLETLKNTNWV